jgi:hypothetical protein
MDVQTITMDRADAFSKLLQYQEAVKRSKDLADRILVKTYKQLAEGRALVNLKDVIRAAGVDELHRPRFAVARANQTHVWFTTRSWTRNGYLPRFSTYRDKFGQDSDRATRHHIELPAGLWPECPANCHEINPHIRHPSRLRAMVPLIPPQLRPEDSLGNYHILWDVKGAWQEEPPRDPFLLKCVDGDLYAVHAVWDLTDLEMQVMKALRGTV